MGLDAEISIKFRQEPTQEQLNELNYQIGCRYGDIVWQEKDESGKKNFAVVRKDDRDWKDAPATYYVSMFCRYYGKDYERGPALKLFGLLDFLRRQKLIAAVYYGNDCSDDYEEVTETLLQELLALWQSAGRLPYQKYFDKDKDGPECCAHQMIRCGWGGDWAKWFCPCCGATAERHGDAPVKINYKDNE